MILLLIYMCLCLVIKMNCMYTWWVDCSMSYVNCVQIVLSCCWRGFVASYWFINKIFEMKWIYKLIIYRTIWQTKNSKWRHYPVTNFIYEKKLNATNSNWYIVGPRACNEYWSIQVVSWVVWQTKILIFKRNC
jgi:hypothetical protein